MRSKVLKLLAVISFGLVTFPFLFTNDVLAFGNISVIRLLCYYAGCSVICVTGYLFAKAVIRHKKLLPLERITGVLFFSVGLLLLFFIKEVNIIIAFGVSAVLWYFLGERAAHKHYADIFPASVFGVYIGVTLLSYLFYSGMCEAELKEPVLSAVIGAFMIELCLAALLINQSNIYDKANRRRETRAMLPKGLSGYNAALVLGIAAVGLFLYFFTDKIVWLLNNVIRLIIKAVLFMLKGYSEFMQTEDISYDIPDGGGYTSMQQSSVWQVVFVFILITCIIIFRKKIFSAIKEAVRRFIGLFLRETEKSEPEPEFTDIFEEIDYSKRKKNSYIYYGGLMKSYKSETDLIKKYRFGYAVLLMQLKAFRADIRCSDTVTVQYEKGRDICGPELKPIADFYEKLRYADEDVISDELIRLDGVIMRLNGLMKGK